MKHIFLILLIFSIQLYSYSQNIKVEVLEKNTGDKIPYPSISIEYTDSLVNDIADVNGEYVFQPISFPFKIKANGFGMEENSVFISNMPDSVIIIELTPGSIELSEITVNGKLVTQTNSGISYNMSANKRAQEENTLQSLSYVPLINVSPEGSISVQGSSNYTLYLNGRPYEMAQTDPKIFLESLPASSIKKVEVITHEENKFGADTKGYVINIVLKNPILEGYVLNLNGGGNTQPSANGSITGMFKKNKIDASIGYNYNLNGQRDQPYDITYSEKDNKGEISNIWKTEGTGKGDWHTHTIRAMLKWEIDSLNTLYMDAHGQIRQTNLQGDLTQSNIFPEHNFQIININNLSKYTSGSAEANLIFRNYYNNNPDIERITVGYHYTYNPDKRKILQTQTLGNDIAYTNLQKTNGGLNAHSALISYLIKPSVYHSFRVTARDTYRIGKTESWYDNEEMVDNPDNSMTYRNNIADLTLSYAGWLGNVYAMASIKGNYDYFTMRLPQTPTLDYKRNRWYVLPSASIYWRPTQNNSLNLNYTTDLQRPAIEQLNPFESSTNDHLIERGNPNLKAQYNHNLLLSWYCTAINNLTLVTSLNYGHSEDVILPYSVAEGDIMVSSFSNFGKTNYGEVALYGEYNIKNWSSISLDFGLGKRWLNSDSPVLRQNDLAIRITPKIDFYLPNHWRIGGQFGYYKNLPNPWSTRTSLTLYSFYLNKSFLSGRLNLTLSANSPFNKYNHSKVITSLPGMNTVQNNYITARSFGLNLSYSFGGGKNVKIERDNTLESKDQNTGVK